MTITVHDTARAAAAIYYNNDFQDFTMLGGFFDPKNTNRFGWQKAGDAGGASGGIYKYNLHSKMYIISLRGSSNMPWTKGDGGKDWLSDDRMLAAGFTPDRAADCVRFVESMMTLYKGSQFIVAGHSLGGYLAQVVGVLCGLPFISWNAPPALSTWNGKLAAAAGATNYRKGLNYRIRWDPVSSLSYGKHVGPVCTLPFTGGNMLTAHTTAAIERTISASPLRGKSALACIAEANPLGIGQHRG